jgi:tRNA 5-methylaminomethyl-2-thiouridine biosynthesis bifunctional protein
VGALPDFSSMRSEAQSYQSGTDLLARVQMSPLPGMYVSLGHGSRGLNSCPMSGEIVARLISNEPLGALSDVAQILSPERLALRILSAAVA